MKERTQLLYSGEMDYPEGMYPDSPAIFPATAYAMRDTQHYYAVSSGNGEYQYNRTANPNRDSLSAAISMMEDGDVSAVMASGMAAISATLLSLLKQGDHLVVNESIYGETIELIDLILIPLGVTVTYADFLSPAAISAAIRPETVMFYTEIISNPLIKVIDIDAVSAISRKHQCLLVVDNTFSTPFVIKPLQHGADIVIHSLTKFFGGHSDLTAGSVTCSLALMQKIELKARLLGGCSDPYTAWLCLRSIRTMEMRVTRQMENAQAIAQALSRDPRVAQVNYPGLESHPQHTLADSLFIHGYGPMLSFRVRDEQPLVDAFIHRLELITYLGTLGGFRTSLAHPATAFRTEFTPQQLIDFGMHEGLIRISAGCEAAEDLIADITQALDVFN